MSVLLPDGKTQAYDFTVIRDIAEGPPWCEVRTHYALHSGLIEWIEETRNTFMRWRCHYRRILTTDGVTYRPEYDAEPQLMEARRGP